jgi:hypothetical protein
MPDAYTNTDVSAPIETTADLGAPKSMVLQDGKRYIRNDGRTTGVLIRSETAASVAEFRDTLYDCYFAADGRRLGYEREDGSSIDRILEEGPYPFEVMVGGVYRCRDGSLTGYLSPTQSATSTYPFTAVSTGITYSKHGSSFIGHENPTDLVEAVYLPLLRDGWYGRRRDGKLTGKMVAYGRHSSLDQYLFRDMQYGDTYSPCGQVTVGIERAGDIIEMVAEWDGGTTDTPNLDGILPLKIGDLVTINDCGDQVIYRDYAGHPRTLVGNIDLDTGVLAVEDGCWRRYVEKIVRRVEHFNIPDDRVTTFVKTDYAFRYKWVYLGTNVHLSYIQPWAYSSSGDSYGSLKCSSQRMDGCHGAYLIGIPLSCDLDPESIEGRRYSASIKALAKYWEHRAKVQMESKTNDQGVSNGDFLGRAERLMHKEFNHMSLTTSIEVSDRILHVTYETAATALVLSRENGYYKCKPLTWAKVFTALNKEIGVETTDEMRRLFMERLDTALNVSEVDIEWSSVDDTYCTPMEGWSDSNDAVTGSCMEKFCNDDGNGHEVFLVYKKLERLQRLKMIKILIEDQYVGRAICWWPNATSGWVMDRVYCRMSRGEIPVAVIARLAKFAAENQIIGRTEKCKVFALPQVRMADISAEGLFGYEYYPYFDTYAGISDEGVHMCSSSCTTVCDCPDGEPSSRDLHEARGRDGRYEEDELRWSEYYDEYVHEDDAICLEDGTYIHSDDAVELGFNSGVYAHHEDTVEVRLPNRHGRVETVYAIPA